MDKSSDKCIAFHVAANHEKVLVALDGKALVATLLTMSTASALVIRMMSSGVRHCHPVHETTHPPIPAKRDNHVPVIAHPLVSEPINGEFLKSFAKHPLKPFVVGILVEDGHPAIAPVPSMMDFTGKIGAW